MSRPKGGRSVQLRGTAFESERSRHFPYMDLFCQVGRKCCFHSQSAMLGTRTAFALYRAGMALATIANELHVVLSSQR